MTGEFDFINRIRKQTAGHPQLPLGIGDDAAEVLFGESQTPVVVTVDMLMDQVHFDLKTTSPERIGRKALAVNLSDIAAMGAEPVAVVVSYAIPKQSGTGFAEKIHNGIEQLASQYNVAIAGGDTNSWDGPFVISVTAMGNPIGSTTIKRSGARVGDSIFVTGSLGGSLSGSHLTFEPRLHEAKALIETVPIYSMIDLSDGLSSDLLHILKESQVGAVIESEAIPISKAALETSDEQTPLQHALNDGEDFELLFTVSPQNGQQLLKQPPFKTRLTKIGTITEGNAAMLCINGELISLKREGWEHQL